MSNFKSLIQLRQSCIIKLCGQMPYILFEGEDFFSNKSNYWCLAQSDILIGNLIPRRKITRVIWCDGYVCCVLYDSSLLPLNDNLLKLRPLSHDSTNNILGQSVNELSEKKKAFYSLLKKRLYLVRQLSTISRIFLDSQDEDFLLTYNDTPVGLCHLRCVSMMNQLSDFEFTSGSVYAFTIPIDQSEILNYLAKLKDSFVFGNSVVNNSTLVLF